MTGCTVSRYAQLETSPETIEQELRPAVCEHRQTERLKENYSIDEDTESDSSYSQLISFCSTLNLHFSRICHIEMVTMQPLHCSVSYLIADDANTCIVISGTFFY